MRLLERGGVPPWLALAGTIAAALAGAQIVHMFVEVPAMALIRQWWKSPRMVRQA
jgi:peptidoglycan/LPS O-acetylase OafA/YrhL